MSKGEYKKLCEEHAKENNFCGFYHELKKWADERKNLNNFGNVFHVESRKEKCGLATCNKDPKNKEVKLTRALFNSYNKNKNSFFKLGPRKVQFLYYEAPLLRQKAGKYSGQVHCDLIGIEEEKKELIAIENKVENGDRPRKAFWQALGYGILLKYLLEESHLNESAKRFCIKNLSEYSVHFCAAAPKDYFERKRRYNPFDLVKRYESFRKNNTNFPAFLGFVQIPCQIDERTHKKLDNENIIPIMKAGGGTVCHKIGT